MAGLVPGACRSLLALICIAGLATAADAAPSHRKPPRPTAPIRWVSPPSRVVLDCPDRVVRRPEWVAFGQELDGMGIEVRRPRGTDPSASSLFRVRCLAKGEAPDPDPAVRSIPAEDAAPSIRRLLQEARDTLRGDAFPRPSRVLLAGWDDGEVSTALLREASWMAAYSRLEADFLDLRRLDRLPDPWLLRYDAVAMLTDHLPPATAESLGATLGRYLEAGGSVVLMGGIDDEVFRSLAGAKAAAGEALLREWTCDPGFLPGSGGTAFRIPDEDADPMPLYRAPEGARILCGVRGSDAPLAFQVRRGRGTVVAWTVPVPADKSARGLMLLSLMEATPLVSALVDAHLFFLDDCPLPTSNRPVRVEAGAPEIPDGEFYRNRWWPDVRSLIETHSLRPTFAFILTYDDRMPEEGVPGTYGEGSPSLELARAISAAGYEVDLHGFNHQSLSLARNEWSVGWSGIGAMRKALTMLRAEYRRVFGGDRLPRAYVAPSNFVQRVGKEALRQVFPEIEVLSTQYLDEGPILGQEFGPDPEVPGLWNLPRISSEHFLDADNAQEVLDALVLPGVFSHFIHPDDLLDPERSRGRDWPGMVRELSSLLEKVDRSHPWMTRRTAVEASAHLRQWWKAGLRVLREAEGILVHVESPPDGGLTFWVRPPRDREARIQGTCEEVFRSRAESRIVLRSRGGACGIFWR